MFGSGIRTAGVQVSCPFRGMCRQFSIEEGSIAIGSFVGVVGIIEALAYLLSTMTKQSKEQREKVTIQLNEEEQKILIAIACRLQQREATAKDWKELAKRFGFRDHKQLRRYLFDRLPSDGSSPSSYI